MTDHATKKCVAIGGIACERAIPPNRNVAKKTNENVKTRFYDKLRKRLCRHEAKCRDETLRWTSAVNDRQQIQLFET